MQMITSSLQHFKKRLMHRQQPETNHINGQLQLSICNSRPASNKESIYLAILSRGDDLGYWGGLLGGVRVGQELNEFFQLFQQIINLIMTITIKTRRLRVNKLLARKELLLDVYHEGKPNVSQKDLRELIAAKYHWEPKNIVLFGFRTAFGGNRSTGFVLAYDNQQYLVKYEPNYRLRRAKVLPKRNPKRKSEKELKRKIKKSRGAEKRKVLATRKVETKNDIRRHKEDYLKKLIA